MQSSIGLIEVSSVAQGYLVTDTMLKTANVELLTARTICAGKYMSLISGDVGAVNSSVKAGEKIADYTLIHSIVIPNIHNDVISAIRGLTYIEKPEALGIVESFSVAALIEGADAAVKAADIKLIEVRVAMALGGKAFFTATGTIADVTASVDAAAEIIGNKGLLVNKIIIPRPHKDVYREIL